MFAWLLGACLAALVALYMVRPRIERRRLSSARFFRDLPPMQQGRPRLRLSNPLTSRAFFLQLLVLLLLLAAAISAERTMAAARPQSAGVWIALDTSASMSTVQGGESRIRAARGEIEALQSAIARAVPSGATCYRLSAFDLERRDLLTTRNGAAVRAAVAGIEPRPLGTNLDLVRALLAGIEEAPSDCPLTHLVVVSDLPAPEWLSGDESLRVIWRDIGLPVNNSGLTAIRPLRDPLTGTVRSLRVEVRAFGQAPRAARLLIRRADGLLQEEPVAWQGDNSWQLEFAPTESGRYTLELEPEDPYLYDNMAVIDLSDEQVVRVDWRLENRGLMQALTWVQDSHAPHLRVAAEPVEGDRLPTLVVGAGYPSTPAGPVEIRDFSERSPLLADLNFDVAETLGITGARALPPGFRPVLRGMDESIWVAERLDPPAAFVPGLPTEGDDDRARFSTTLFFNAVRRLLQERPLPPLYRLTSVAEPTVEENRIALHPDEGNTALEPRSFGSLDDLGRAPGRAGEQPLWPLPLAVAAAAFLFERMMSAYGGPKWR